MAQYTLEVLAPTHDVGAFVSGREEIDTYIRQHAANERAMGLCQVWVVVDGTRRVCAFGTLSTVSVRLTEDVVQRLHLEGAPYRAIGGYLLGRMGVQQDLQGQGIGRSLVARLAKLAAQQRETTGGVFLAVDAKDDALVKWYEKLGFIRLSTGTRRLVLPLASVPA